MLVLIIIGIALCLIALYVLNHDNFARADLAEHKLDNQANSTSDCYILHIMTDLHKNDWFKDNYVKIAENRMVELKC